jgi:hypothetical protein
MQKENSSVIPREYENAHEITSKIVEAFSKQRETTIIMDWHKYEDYQTTTLYRQLLVNIFGKDAIEKYKNKVILLPTMDAGWGHRIEAYGFALDLVRTLKCYVLFYYPTEYASNKIELFFYNLKLAVLHAMHTGNPIEGVLINIPIELPSIDRIKLAFLKFLMLPIFKITQEKSGYKDSNQGFFHKLVLPILITNRFFVALIARVITSLDILLLRTTFTKILVNLSKH